MLDVQLPARDDLAPVIRGFAACLGSVIEVPIVELVPETADSLGDAIGHWRGWLAGRGDGLVEIPEPARFHGRAIGLLSSCRKLAARQAMQQ